MTATLDTLQAQVAGLSVNSTALFDAVKAQKTALDTAVASATAAAALAASNNALTDAARDAAWAGLGVADQSGNLVNLTYALGFALDQASLANRRVGDVHNALVQTGVATITQTASTELVRTYASATVTLPRAYTDTGYQVVAEVESAAPHAGATASPGLAGFAGEVLVMSRAVNSFVLAITGSATLATVRWKVLHPGAVKRATAFEDANTYIYGTGHNPLTGAAI